MMRPNIQIDDEVREMTDEEYAEWQMSAAQPLLIPYEEIATE